MNMENLCSSLSADVLHRSGAFSSLEISNIVASDLMSDVLVANRDDFLLVTSLASDQMIRTADLVGACGVVLVNGKRPPSSLLQLSRTLDITLMVTPLAKYEACLAIGQASGRQRS